MAIAGCHTLDWLIDFLLVEISPGVFTIALKPTIHADNIDEQTPGHGVIADGVVLKDGEAGGIPLADGKAGGVALAGGGLEATAGIGVTRAYALQLAFSSTVIGDTYGRFRSLAGGIWSWGPGGADSFDVTLSRLGASKLGVGGDDTFQAPTIETDTINEKTPDAGVTIDSVLLKDGYPQLGEISTPANPPQNDLKVFARASGANIQLIARSSQGAEAVLATLSDTGAAPNVKFMMLGVKQ